MRIVRQRSGAFERLTRELQVAELRIRDAAEHQPERAVTRPTRPRARKRVTDGERLPREDRACDVDATTTRSIGGRGAFVTGRIGRLRVTDVTPARRRARFVFSCRKERRRRSHVPSLFGIDRRHGRRTTTTGGAGDRARPAREACADE